MTAEEAIADYLTLVFSHAKEALVKRYTAQMVSTTTIEVILTVPAIWTDAAKDATFRAAKKAGMGPNLKMVSEPEAAAIYSLKSMEQESKMLKVGDNFIVCDAGGGTIDLIAHEIRSLSPLTLEESAPGTGALCGGVFLNLRFQELVKSRMGEAAFKNLCERKPKSWAIALKYFEDYVKKNFDPLDSQEEYDDNKFNVPLPGAEDDVSAGIDCGFITLSTAEVAELFRPLVNSVIDLVERQRNMLGAYGKTAKGVILVGGFGQSNYLFKCLKSRFADEDPPPQYTRAADEAVSEPDTKFVVLQPANAWTAVVRGAVLASLRKKVVLSRKARRHYGIVCNSLFDATKHPERLKYWSSKSETWRANEQLSWHIERDADLPTDQPILITFYSSWWHHEGWPDSVSLRIIVSDALHPPVEFDPSRETRVLCRLKVDLENVPRHLFEECTNSKGLLYRTLYYKVGMIVQSGMYIGIEYEYRANLSLCLGSVYFDLRVNDVVYGVVSANFE